MSDSIRFKKVNFYHYKKDGKFGMTFKHNDQMYELQFTNLGDKFAFDFVPLIKNEWDYDNPIFDNIISEGKLHRGNE